MQNQRALLSFTFLSSLFWISAFLGWILMSTQFVLLTEAPILMQVDATDYPIFLGHLPLSLCFALGCMLILQVITEFFGRTLAFFHCVLISALLLNAVFWLHLLPWFPGFEDSVGNPIVQTFSTTSQKESMAWILSTFSIGFVILTFLQEQIRKWTHNRFSFIRISLSTLVALVPLTASFSYLLLAPQISTGAWLASWITSLIQWIALWILSIPFYYTLEWVGEWLVGKEQLATLSQRFLKKAIFRPEEKSFFGSRKELQANRI